MNAHQVITGALNNGEHVYALGNIEGLTFTACAVGSDVVILDSDFNRVQIIPIVKSNILVTSLSCCKETGKIAVTYGNLVRLLEAKSSGIEKARRKSSIFQFTWIETYCFKTKELISSVLWTMEGMRILFVLSNKLVLRQHRNVNSGKLQGATSPVFFSVAEEDVVESNVWEVVWSTVLPFVPKFVRYSPDGYYLALTGENDCFIKLFYHKRTEKDTIHFSALTLSHPAPVCGFEWRKTGRYMPRKCINPTLISWCEDQTSRIWRESPPPETSIIDLTGEGGGEPLWEKQKTKTFFGKHIKVKKTKNKILKRLRSLVPERIEHLENNAIGLRAQIGKSHSSYELHNSSLTQDCMEIQFHLAATINAQTDCLFAPSVDVMNNGKPFCVHWLNNKELVFSVGAEKLLAEAVFLDLDGDHTNNSNASKNENKRENDSHWQRHFEKHEKSSPSVCPENLSSKDVLDVKLEILLRQWSKSNDVLFAIHPLDGSLLTWTIEWLDDYYRQPVVSYSSRLPGALPLSDAQCLHSKLNTFNPHEPIYLDVLRTESDNKENSSAVDKFFDRQVSNTIHILTSHDNGTLNLWHMAVDDQSSFSQVVSMTHVSRMCGHRFQMQQISAHPVLPLLLTTSKFNSLDGIADSNTDIFSEVILWKITPVGPLCKEGGVRELARVASSLITGFSSVGWIPVILPSCTLGAVCNSPSSCFISFDGNQLVIYQTILDARNLLAEFSNLKTSSNSNKRLTTSNLQASSSFLKGFNIVSTQSTAKPGCILEVGKIEDLNLNNFKLLFMHIFQLQVLIGEKYQSNSTETGDSIVVTTEGKTFSETFFIVMIENNVENDMLLMYSLTIEFRSEFLEGNETKKTDENPLHKSDLFSLPIEKLNFKAKLVCRQALNISEGTRIISVSPAAGHLSSSSLYPACRAPYALVTTDTDDCIRFWCCEKLNETGSKNKFEWREWNMISDTHPSELPVEGTIIRASAAHNGRLACAYRKTQVDQESRFGSIEISVFECESSGGVEWFREDSFGIQEENKVFQKLLKTKSKKIKLHQQSQAEKEHSIDTYDVDEKILREFGGNVQLNEELIRLDWVSTEDGAHMLTVGVGTNIYIYAQTSQDPAQQNVALMKESETTLRRPTLRKASSFSPNVQSHTVFTRWLCCRVLALETADGLPPIPTTMSWARDGLFIVGMQSEMRVYNQWNFVPSGTDYKKCSSTERNTQVVSLTISTSHSMLDQLIKKKEALVSSRSRVFLDFVNNFHKSQAKESENDAIIDVLKNEGVFEAARMSSPILPQYHPKQLIVLFNAGKKKRVKAILNHVLNYLKQQRKTVQNSISRVASIKRISTVNQNCLETGEYTPRIEDENMEYDEIDNIPLLPLYALVTVDEDDSKEKSKLDEFESKNVSEYDGLFQNDSNGEDDIDQLLKDNDSVLSGKSRHFSTGSDIIQNEPNVSTTFTATDYRQMSDLLTHTHLPGLSSVDQMHLLALADTLSHFTSDVKNKVERANFAMHPVVPSVLGDTTAGGYATAAAGVETVDECGLRYLMAMKQHEFLLVCLPIKQRRELKKKGLSPANIIWAQHSETETELLNAVPGMQKANPTWDELKGLGIAWWLKNTASLRICIEKLAKAAFQQNQDPMDASLFYLALRKKNVLTHLFKTVRNQAMFEFFMNDFSLDYWKKVAAKNAFVLMSKQRFQHAAAFFLLGGSLKDAIQTILIKCNDLQLALVVARLFETDVEAQQQMINTILCREVLGCPSNQFDNRCGKTTDESSLSIHASKEPFERSMAFWIMKDYANAADTLVQEAQSDRYQSCLSDIFNFYSYLRKHPLVVRQRLSKAGGQVGTTEKFLALGKQLEGILTPPERKLFFRTSAEHMSRGCPMLSLDVLNMLPKHISTVQDYDEALEILFDRNNVILVKKEIEKPLTDWSLSVCTQETSDLSLDWSDDEAGANEENTIKNISSNQMDKIEKKNNDQSLLPELSKKPIGAPDLFAQHMKYVASLRILTEEMSTLASGHIVDGDQLRQQLLNWLSREIAVLENNCNYETEAGVLTNVSKNQKLLRSFISFCTLHSGQNHKLASILMELLLILLSVQTDGNEELLKKDDNCDETIPLLDSAISTSKMFVLSPLGYIENQCSDLLTAISEMLAVPNIENDLQKCYMLYNLSQGFASCLYQSLFDTKIFCSPCDDISTKKKDTNDLNYRVLTPPVKWPGVDVLIAFMGREKEDDVPHLRLLIVESFVAINMALFCFALSAYDSRWLYRLSAHEIDPKKFGMIFGGGGEYEKKTKPTRPPRPNVNNTTENINVDADHLRSRLNLRVLGFELQKSTSMVSVPEKTLPYSYQWIPPQKNIVQLFAEKPFVSHSNESGTDYDSDREDQEYDDLAEKESDETIPLCENATPSSFAWQLLRLVLLHQQLYRTEQFLVMTGFDPRDIASVAPRIDMILRKLKFWVAQQTKLLNNFVGGIPNDILPDMTIEINNQHTAISIKKYAVILKKNNTPFESDDYKIQAIQRLWSYLVREDHLQEIFIKYIFAQISIMEQSPECTNNVFCSIDNSENLPEAFRVIQKDNEPIVAFACNQEHSGLVVVSNGRELQEMDMTDIFKDQNEQTSWMWNRAELDMNNYHFKKDNTRDNDDYQILTGMATNQHGKQTNFIMKRQISGIRRIDSHPNAPFYVTGSSDGAIKVWKWGIKDAVYTARVAGQYAKVTKIAFSCNGNKFAAVDGDGMLCLWQAGHAIEQKKPFFSQRCHNKSANDVRFLGHSSSVLITAGSSSSDYNLGLWDTLLPTNRALVHSWVAHPEGAICALYLPNQQTIFSGGRHGEICLWDVRQRQLRHTIRAFDQTHVVKTLVSDASQDLIVAGSSEGDIKIWAVDSTPQLMYNLTGEHSAKGGFSFRQVGQSVQGVQQMFIDQNMRLFSCGADSSLKFRTLPSVFNMANFL